MNAFKEKYEVKYWGNRRFAIFAKDSGEIVDNASGYGYKSQNSAEKAMWYKFGGGKEKKKKELNMAKTWLKNEKNNEAFEKINEQIEWNIKEIARGEITVEEIISEIEIEYGIKIPKFVKTKLFN